MPTFDVQDRSDSLQGRRLIEASAGTGKTFSLVEIVRRRIAESAEPIDISRLLLVTFTNAATAELTDRLKAGLEKSLRDETDSALAARFAAALEHFDDACIMTIHGFCRKMLSDYTFLHGGRYGAELDLDDSEYTAQVAEEFVRDKVRGLGPDDALKLASFEDALARLLKDLAARGEVPPFRVVPDDGGALSSAMKEYPAWALKRLAELKREAGVMSADEMLSLMAAKVRDVPEFAQAVRERFDIVLIDEFQDTDSVQYEIFRRLFLEGDGGPQTVFFVGDPKQAIYRFRRAELATYLEARSDMGAGNVFSLRRNFRTTRALLDAFNAFFSYQAKDAPDGNAFFSSEILYEQVDCGNREKTPVMELGKDGMLRPLPVLEVLTDKQPGSEPVRDWISDTSVEAIRAAEDDWIAADIARLLSGRFYIGPRRVRPADIAILVSQRKHAENLIGALRVLRIPVCMPSNSDVFATEQAGEILNVLKAIESPTDLRLLNVVRTSRIFGDTMKTFGGDQQAVLRAREDVEAAALKYRRAGLTAAFDLLFERRSVVSRILPLREGRQHLRNYAHVIELLQQQSQRLAALSGLIRWFEAERSAESAPEERYVRIESDENLVTVETIHGSKGLEYPIVYLTHASFAVAAKKAKSGFFKTTENGRCLFEMILDPEAQPEDEVNLENRENVQEAARRAYVAMTRASSRLVLPLAQKRKKDGGAHSATARNIYWMMSSGETQVGDSARTEALFEERLDAIRQALRSDADAICADLAGNAALKAPVDAASITAEALFRVNVPPFDAAAQCAAGQDVGEPEEEPVCGTDPARAVSAAWSSTSFSALRRGADHAMPGSCLDPDEEAAAEPQESLSEQAPDIVNLWGGTQIGTMLHEIFEKTDFEALNRLSAEAFSDHIEQLLRPYQGLLGEDYAYAHGAVTRMARDVLSSVLPGGVVLSSVPMRERFSELEFDLYAGEPAPGRETLTERRLIEALGILCRAHRTDPGYTPEYLAPGAIRGIVKGFIDLFFFARGRYWVIDWKSNRVSGSARGYTQSALAAEMQRHGYRLQYLIYLVAAMRFLKARLGPETDVYGRLGGALYLFIRGVRPDAPGQGVVFDRPRRAVLECLDDLFSRGWSREVVEAYAARVREEESHD